MKAITLDVLQNTADVLAKSEDFQSQDLTLTEDRATFILGGARIADALGLLDDSVKDWLKDCGSSKEQIMTAVCPMMFHAFGALLQVVHSELHKNPRALMTVVLMCMLEDTAKKHEDRPSRFNTDAFGA